MGANSFTLLIDALRRGFSGCLELVRSLRRKSHSLLRTLLFLRLHNQLPSPEKPDSRHVGIPRIPNDDKRTYQDLTSSANGLFHRIATLHF